MAGGGVPAIIIYTYYVIIIITNLFDVKFTVLNIFERGDWRV